MPRMSQSEYVAFLARSQHREKADASGAVPVEEESTLHDQILDECKKRGWLAFHGSMAHRTFRTPGEPDFIILANGRIFFVECKTRAGKLSIAQSAMIAHAAKLGHTIHVVRSFREFLEIVK